MPYAKVTTPARKALISLDLANWGAPYQALFDQTDVSGYEAWLAYSHNNFDNPFQKADEQRYKDNGWWAEIFRDKVVDSTDDGKIVYISRAGTPAEREHKVTAPANGWYVPDGDILFVPDTLIPVRTIQDRSEARKLWQEAGFPQEQTSYFFKPDRYKNDERFVGRGFGPDLVDLGRFDVDAGWHPSYSGGGRVASRPIAAIDVVMEATA